MIEENIEEIQSEEPTSQPAEDIDDNNDETSADTGTDEDVEALKSKIKDLEDKNKQLYARTKKPAKKVAPSESNLKDIGLIKFFAQGNNEEDYEVIKTIMKGKDVDFNEALKDNIYQFHLKQKAETEKTDKAQLPSSRKSYVDNSTNIEDMTREEHMEAWKNA